MLGIAREEQSNPVELKFFRGTTGANVVADATPDADRTLRLRSTVPGTTGLLAQSVRCTTSKQATRVRLPVS